MKIIEQTREREGREGENGISDVGPGGGTRSEFPDTIGRPAWKSH